MIVLGIILSNQTGAAPMTTLCPTVSINNCTLTCANPTATITATANPTLGVTYYWNPGHQTTSSISVTTSGTYCVTVTKSSTGCTVTACATVTSAPGLSITACSNDNSGCAVQNSCIQTSCQGHVQHCFSLPNCGLGSDDFNFEQPGGYCVQYNDGSCHLTGVACNAADPTYRYNVDLWFRNRRNWSQWHTLGRSYRDDAGYAGTNYANWCYYELDETRPHTITGCGNYTGQSFTVTHRYSGYQYGFQCGTAANCEDANDGIGGWLNCSGNYTGTCDLNTNSVNYQNSGCNGSASVCAMTGSGPYTYHWSNGGTTYQITGLCAGTYIATVTDHNGCTATSSVTVNNTNNVPTVTVNNATISCANPSPVITATATPTSGISYYWNPGHQTTSSITVTTAGTYCVTVTNTTNGCSATACATVTGVINPPTVTVNNCLIICSASSGVLNAIASPTTGITYNWNPGGATTSSLTVTAAGTYCVTVTKTSTGCTATACGTVTQQPSLNVTACATDNSGCAVQNSCVVTNCQGNIQHCFSLPNCGLGSDDFNFEQPGGYCVQYNDGSCHLTGVACNASDPTYRWNVDLWFRNRCNWNQWNTQGRSYRNDAGLAGTNYTNWCFYELDETRPHTINGCGNYTGQSFTVTHRYSGYQYGFQFGNAANCEDGNDGIGGWLNCTGNYSGTCDLNTNSINYQNSGCNGSASVCAMTGTGPYTYHWSNGGTTNQITNLCAGTYIVTVTDHNGCTATSSVTVNNNANIPTVTVNNATLSCSTPNPVLTATATPSTGVSYFWNPGHQTTSSITVTTIGTYCVTVTNTTNGCTATACGTVTGNNSPPTVTVNNGVLTCVVSSVSLSAVANPSTGVTYAWNPGGSTSSAISATTAGTYCVTVTKTSNGCTATACGMVTGPASPPTVTVNNATISCTNQNATLTANSSPSTGVTYLWAPGNQTTSSITVSTAGTYCVTLTRTSDGCTATACGTVNGNRTPPTVSVNNGVLNCITSSLTLTATTNPATGVTYVWNPGGSTSSSISVNASGTYCVTVTNTTNSCTATACGTVTGNSTNPTVSVNNVTLTCSSQSATLLASTTPATGLSYNWNPGGATTSSIVVTSAGSYCVTVTNPANGCTATACGNVNANLTPPVVTVNNGTITCANPTVSLLANATPSNVSYNWSPGGSTAASITTTATGTYCVVVTDPVNGCTASACGSVNQNTTPPLVSVNNATITCANPVVTLSATTTPSTGVTYLWNPGGSSSSSIQVSANGTYCVTVTNLTNGCTATACGSVNTNTTAPSVTVSNATITCANSSVTLVASATPAGVNYNWSPGGSTTSSIVVSSTGSYCVFVTNPANGCTASACGTVNQNLTPPLVSVNNATITCANAVVTLTVTSTPSTGVSYLWNPGGSTSSSMQVSAVGTYCVTVTNTVNGCSATTCGSVNTNLNPPVVNVNNATITCTNPSVTLLANVAPATVTYNWTPGGSTASSIVATSAGSYCVIVTNPTNGCTASACGTVNQNITAPLVSVNDATINCANAVVTLVATTTPVSGLSYLWNAGGATTSSIQVSTTGTWCVTVTNPLNGCTASGCGSVNINTTPPTVTVNNGSISCAVPSATLTANPSPAIVNYFWNPTGLTSASISVGSAGTYCVTVTNPVNGCTASACGTVSQNVNMPQVSVNNATITCRDAIVTLSATPLPGMTYLWNPGGSTSTSIQVSAVGTYCVTVTNPLNGCSASACGSVNNNLNPPVINVNSPTITCLNRIVALTANASPLNVSYLWVPGGATTSSITTSSTGTYCVTVTDPVNGCTASACGIVNQDITQPLVSVNNATITCAVGEVLLSATTTPSTGVSYLWNPGGSTTSQILTTVAGTYCVTVTRVSNGCTATACGSVNTNLNHPVVTVNNGTITCINTSVTLVASSTPPTVQYDWNPVGSSASSITVSSAGTYCVTVTNPVNGCTATSCGTVNQNFTTPQVSVNNATITCANPVGTLTATTTPSIGVSYLWNPGGSTAASIQVTQAGTYCVTVTNIASGCSASNCGSVNTNLSAPIVNVNNATLTCVNLSATLTANAAPLNVSYNWNPGGSTAASIVTTVAGTYCVTVTNPLNGCTATACGVVNGNTIQPTVQVNGGTIDCRNPSVILNATATPATSISYAWNPGGATTSSILVTLGGSYCVTVTNIVNGCTATSCGTVTVDTIRPVLSVNNATISCSVPCVTLNSTVSPSVGITYFWNPSGATTNNLLACTTGTYCVTVTKASNGCTASACGTVIADTTKPVVSVNNGTLTCTNTSVSLIATSNPSTQVQYSWNPGGSTASSISVTTAGTYCVTVTKTTNGCSASACGSVTGNSIQPAVQVNNATITCTNSSATLSATATPVGVGLTYLWNPGGSTATSITVTVGGTYCVTVTNPINGCTATACGVVTMDTIRPVVTINTVVLTCANTSGILTATTVPPTGVTYSWSQFGETTQSINVSDVNLYCVTVTRTSNGCTASACRQVTVNNIPPAIQLAGGTISCANPSVTLTPVVTPPTGNTYLWNPGGATTTSLTVTSAGTYCVTVTNTASGCSATACATVNGNNTPPTVQVNSGVITCSNPTVTLNAVSTPSTGVTYLWNPTGLTTASITVSAAGTYCVTVTNTLTGCSVSMCGTVTGNISPPTVTVNNASISCANGSATLTATATPSTGVTYHWNPGGSSALSITVTAAGTYCVTVTKTSNGCTATACGTVTGNISPPVVSVNNATITCGNPSATLTATVTPPTGVTYLWNPGGSTASSITVSATGTYCVTVTNTASGCTATACGIVSGTVTPPTVTVNSPTLTCANPSATLTATTTPPTGNTYLWNPGGSTAASITVTTAGTYCVTITNTTTGCTASACGTVTGNATPPTAQVNNGVITCSNTSVILNANASPSTGVTYLWNPGGSTAASITVTTAGTYCVTVTRTSNGCSVSVCGTVTGNTVHPTVTVNNATITCANPSATLTATSSPSTGVTYRWNPGTSTASSITVTTPGTWCVTVTNTSNGCTTTACGTVTGSGTPPTVTVNNATITCVNTSATLTATTTPATGNTYLWNPGGSTASFITVTSAGTYCVTITNTTSGCTATACGTVTGNTTPPTAQVNNGVITCSNTSVTLNANASPSTGVTYLWNPGGSTAASITVTTAGTYCVTVTRTSNGCSVSVCGTVTGNTVHPTVSVNNATISCANPTATLTATSSPSTGVTYNWNPGGSTASSITVTTAGTYCVTVTNTANGCTTTACGTVTGSATPPIVTVNNATIGCNNITAVLTATVTPSTGITYLWNQGGVTTPSITVSGGGTYCVTVTNTTTGCTASACATVTVNNTPPTANVNNGVITCSNTSVTLNANASPTTGVTYLWNPGGSTAASITVTTAGTYCVTVTRTSNGCSVSVCGTVTGNTVHPSVTVNNPSLSCGNPSATLTATSSPSTGVTYHWNPGGSSASSITVTTAGTYCVTVTNTANGCTTTACGTVTGSGTPPTVTVNNATIGCNNTTAVLTATATPSTGITYLWSQGGVTTSSITVSGGGTYCVTVTNTATGCTATACGSVTVNNTPPTANVNNGVITCSNASVTLNANASPSTGVTYLWNPGGSTASSITVTSAGTYCVTVTRTSNGCSVSVCGTVTGNTVHPTVNVNNPTISCTNPTATLTATSSPSTGVTYHWNPGNSTASSINVTTTGTWCVTVTNTSNGCTSTACGTVTGSAIPPTVSVNNGTVNCANSSTVLTATTNPSTGLNYHWNPGGATTSSITVTLAGTYCVTVTDQVTGCTASACGTVTQTGGTPPSVIVNTGLITCLYPTATLKSVATGGNCLTYLWSPGGETASDIVATTIGTYCVTVTNCTTGCNTIVCTTVTADTTKPLVTVNSTALSCTTQTATLFANSNPSSLVEYLWSPIGQTTSSITVTATGLYCVTVTNMVNGCSNSACGIVAPCFASSTPARQTTPSTTENPNVLLTTYPNPFNDHTTIEFEVQIRASHVTVAIYNLDGALITRLYDAYTDTGIKHSLLFDAADLPSGIYVYQLISGDETYTGRLSLIK